MAVGAAANEQNFEEITEVFRSKWRTYRKVIDLNHLNHAEVVAAFADQLRAWLTASQPPSSTPRPVHVLDIGVGDGWVDTQVFSQPGVPPLASFTGIDLSGQALTLARAAGIPAPSPDALTLTKADMAEWMPAAASQSFEVVMTAYVIHHLTQEGKATLLRDVHRALAPGGLFLYCDVYSSFLGASREEVMEEWRVKFKAFHGLSPEEQHDLWDGHVSKYDIPEELAVMEGMIKDAGFGQVEQVYDDGFFTVVYAARKAAA